MGAFAEECSDHDLHRQLGTTTPRDSDGDLRRESAPLHSGISDCTLSDRSRTRCSSRIGWNLRQYLTITISSTGNVAPLGERALLERDVEARTGMLPIKQWLADPDRIDQTAERIRLRSPGASLAIVYVPIEAEVEMQVPMWTLMGCRAARGFHVPSQPTSMRGLGCLGLALWAGVSSAQGLTPQGIYPGDTVKDAFTLPYEFEPIVRLRTFYKKTETLSATEQQAWALGGFAGLRSPWLGGIFQFAVVGYTSQRLYGPQGQGGTLVLQSNQDSITALGEAFGALRIAGQTITAYRQLIDRPFINPQDTRMIPNTFEAYTLTGAVDQLSYTGGYMTKMKTRAAESFVWASNVAGGTGPQKGVIYAGATYGLAGSGYVKVDEVYSTDVFNTFYIEGRYPITIDDTTRIVLGGQYYPQRSVGDAQIGSFSTWGYGLQAGMTRGALGAQLYYTQTGRGFTSQSPYGDHPSYLNVQQIVFDTAGEKAWGIRGNVDFADFGARGLTATAIYVAGKDRIDSSTGAALPDHNETDVRVDYAFAKGTTVEGLVATFRYSWLHQDGAAQTQTDLRAILNYAVRF